MTKYALGDPITIRKDLSKGDGLSCYAVTNSMLQFAGDNTVISDVGYDGAYRVQADGGLNWWSAVMFEDLQTVPSQSPEKPDIPQYIADYIEYMKQGNGGVPQLGTLLEDYKQGLDDCVLDWLDLNEATFYKALANGYTSKEPQRYFVKVPHTQSVNDGAQYYRIDPDDELQASGMFYDEGDLYDNPDHWMKFTQEQIERYNLTDCEKVEVQNENS